MRTVEYFQKVFGLHKAEHTTPVSEQNAAMDKNREGLDLTRPTRHFDGRFCGCSSCRAFKTQKEMNEIRHEEDVKNSKAKRQRGEKQ